MSIHSKMQHKIDELEEKINGLSCYIEDGRALVSDYLDSDGEIASQTDLSEWVESGPAVSVARIKREAILELTKYMKEHGNSYHAEVINQWVLSHFENGGVN